MNPSVRNGFQLTPVGISFLLIGAHFLRSGHVFFVLLSILFIGLLFVKRPMVARLVQFGLLLATCEWIQTTFAFVSIRMENGLPWIRLMIILGSVACFTLVSAGVFFLKTQKERYGL
ncbi:MAG: hypothetical protein O3B73_00100 [bacterium]|nr:hypothetical protein [bacterium]